MIVSKAGVRNKSKKDFVSQWLTFTAYAIGCC